MRTALLLDRDGVINVDRGYVSRIEDFAWQDGIFDLLATARRAGHLVVVVTNQSGIGRGYYDEADFAALNAWMCARLVERGTPVDRVYHCPFHPDAVRPEFRAVHPWRKPAPGMILAARDDLGLALERCIMIGDQWTDMQAGQAAGVGTLVLVGEPRGAAPAAAPSVLRLPSTADAAQWLATRHPA